MDYGGWRSGVGDFGEAWEIESIENARPTELGRSFPDTMGFVREAKEMTLYALPWEVALEGTGEKKGSTQLRCGNTYFS